MLLHHHDVCGVRLVGSRAEGRAVEESDYDFIVETDRFDKLVRDMPELLEGLHPLAQQWDRLSHHMCWMVLLPGPVKVDLIFDGRRHRPEPPWTPSRQTLAHMDAHFWDWVLWMRAKRARGDPERVGSELKRMHEHLLAPLGLRDPPNSIDEAVETYRRARNAAEQRFGCRVDRRLETEVLPALLRDCRAWLDRGAR
jgi:hypothetical protein